MKTTDIQARMLAQQALAYLDQRYAYPDCADAVLRWLARRWDRPEIPIDKPVATPVK